MPNYFRKSNETSLTVDQLIQVIIYCFSNTLLGTWHQYDDAIFSQPGLWDSIRSIFPHWKNDPAEGRRLAMITMLPEWERISLKQGEMNAHDALSEINSVVHCVSKAEIENGGLYCPRTTYGFDFMEVCT